MSADSAPLVSEHQPWTVGAPADRTSMRHAMGAFPSGVTVLSTCLGNTPVGMTISSFASVSLDPPLLLQCVARTAGSLPAFRMGRAVVVNVLAHDQAALARRFAGKGEDRFAGTDFHLDDSGSPVLAGTAAWIVEKFFTWSDVKNSPEEKFTKDELLTNITIYWATASQTSSAQIYYENSHSTDRRTGRVTVPTACAVFPKELSYAPRNVLETRYNIVRWTEMSRGGHFAALEEPELLVEDVRAFFRGLR